jgi:hypothetical protein
LFELVVCDRLGRIDAREEEGVGFGWEFLANVGIEVVDFRKVIDLCKSFLCICDDLCDVVSRISSRMVGDYSESGASVQCDRSIEFGYDVSTPMVTFDNDHGAEVSRFGFPIQFEFNA